MTNERPSGSRVLISDEKLSDLFFIDFTANIDNLRFSIVHTPIQMTRLGDTQNVLESTIKDEPSELLHIALKYTRDLKHKIKRKKNWKEECGY